MKMQIQPKRLITAGGTLLCALGIGYFMQSTAQTQQAPAQTPVVTSAGVLGGSGPVLQTPKADTADSAAPAVELNEVTLTSAAPAKLEMPEVATLPVVDVALQEDPDAEVKPEELQQELTCEHALTAATEAAAMVRLSLDAPCMVNERFTLHHNGMMISEVTDNDGQREFVVPALAGNAVFIVAFANGEGAVATVEVTSLTDYDRAVVQWRGDAGLQIHALEFGADYETAGHVWADAARDVSSAALGQGGFVTRHGASDLDNALMAEVYTFPTGVMSRDGEIALSVEAEVTQANCGRDLEAQSIQKQVGGTLKTQDLVLAMPECSAIGDFLVLKNLLNDLKIAAK